MLSHLLGRVEPRPEHFVYGLSLPRRLCYDGSGPQHGEPKHLDEFSANYALFVDSYRWKHLREHRDGAGAEACL